MTHSIARPIAVNLHSLRSRPRASTKDNQRLWCTYDLFGDGTGTPAILRLTEPRKFALVKYNVFQSGSPKAMFVVCGLPWMIRPSFLPLGSTIQIPPAPPQ